MKIVYRGSTQRRARIKCLIEDYNLSRVCIICVLRNDQVVNLCVRDADDYKVEKLIETRFDGQLNRRTHSSTRFCVNEGRYDTRDSNPCLNNGLRDRLRVIHFITFTVRISLALGASPLFAAFRHSVFRPPDGCFCATIRFIFEPNVFLFCIYCNLCDCVCSCAGGIPALESVAKAYTSWQSLFIVHFNYYYSLFCVCCLHILQHSVYIHPLHLLSFHFYFSLFRSIKIYVHRHRRHSPNRLSFSIDSSTRRINIDIAAILICTQAACRCRCSGVTQDVFHLKN